MHLRCREGKERRRGREMVECVRRGREWYDRGKEGRERERERVSDTTGRFAASTVLAANQRGGCKAQGLGCGGYCTLEWTVETVSYMLVSGVGDVAPSPLV